MIYTNAETCRGTGYIGSFTTLALLEAGYKVVIADNLYNSSEETINRIELICGKRPQFYKLDVTDDGAFDKVFDDHPDIDSVIHFAALKVRDHRKRWMENCRMPRAFPWMMGMSCKLVVKLTVLLAGRGGIRRGPPEILPHQRLRHHLPA